jgi:hypothetical protein
MEQGDCGSRSSTSHAKVVAGEAMAKILAGVMGRWQTGIRISVAGDYIFTHDGGGNPGIDACWTNCRVVADSSKFGNIPCALIG